MIGHKRFGSREGGVEVVVTELARRMAALGHEVTCYDRTGSDVMTGEATSLSERIADGVRIVPVKTIDKKGLAALSSSYFATRQAIKDRPDVIHYHAEGPCVPLPLARRAGIRTVATIHGLDWQRAKWGRLASTCIKMGEKAAATQSNELIVLSSSAEGYFKQEYGREATLIHNGVEIRERIDASLIAGRWGLSRGDYILYLGRLVPEKRGDLLVDAFRRLDTDKRLVIAGGGSDTDAFEIELRKRAGSDPRVFLPDSSRVTFSPSSIRMHMSTCSLPMWKVCHFLLWKPCPTVHVALRAMCPNALTFLEVPAQLLPKATFLSLLASFAAFWIIRKGPTSSARVLASA